MSRQEKTREVIRQLKLVREDRGLSIQRILDMVLEAGGNLSIGTVRRVFEDGSEERNFRYEDSIKPIADVLLGVQTNDVVPSSEDSAELDALRALVRYKNSYIAELEAAAANVEAKVQAAKDEQQKKIDFLKRELELRDRQLNAKDQQINDRGRLLDERRDFIYRKDKIIAILSISLAICVLAIIGALLIDRFNPNIGFFWLDDMKAAFGLGSGMSSQGGVNL